MLEHALFEWSGGRGRVHMLPVLWQEKPDRAAYGAQGFGPWINMVFTWRDLWRA